MILLKKSTTKRRKIPVYLLFNKSQQNTIKYKSTKYYQVQRLVYNHILTCTYGIIWYVFFFTSWAMGESLTCTCLLSIHGTLGEYDVK